VLAKPNLSKYLRMLNARGSLLYWKANNARTDGRTDAQYPSAPTDGVTTDITADELRTLARWIDLGAMWGPAVFEDTLAPTLALEGVFANDALTAGAIGTTDVGTGIDPASLTVCIDSGTGTCAALAPGEAAMAGTITLPLATAPALDDELVVSVRDVAGNTTTVRRTVRALLNQPPPNPDVPDDDGPDAGPEPDPGTPTDGSADGDDVVSAGCGCGASTPSTAAVWLSTLLLVGLLRRRRP
jgi:MYXO-CTERM domain-containing protein